MYGMYYRDFGLNISCLLANLKLYDHFYMYHQNNNLPFIITLAFSIKQLKDMIGTFISAFIFSEKKIVTLVPQSTEWSESLPLVLICISTFIKAEITDQNQISNPLRVLSNVVVKIFYKTQRDTHTHTHTEDNLGFASSDIVLYHDAAME